VALKIFSPERYESEALYDEAMERIAKVASRVAQIQHDNLLDVQNFVEQRRIRIMEMEWIDGYDLSRLLAPELLDRTRASVGDDRWRYLNNVIVTAGPQQSRLKPGVAIAIVRECLAALAALHREGIVHGDIKSSNIMVKRTGNAKIIDIGSALALDDIPPTAPARRPTRPPRCSKGRRTRPAPTSRASATCSSKCSPASRRSPGCSRTATCSRPSGRSSTGCRRLLPAEVTCNELLMNFMPRHDRRRSGTKRFPSAEDADLVKEGAASFHRQLIVGGLASEYENEIRAWLDSLACAAGLDGARVTGSHATAPAPCRLAA
jgi:eukaryotic-like serine/threonine-protein kinase